VKYFLGENDRIKLLILLCGEDDELLIKAALGTLAVLSSLQVDIESIKDLDLETSERQRLNDFIEQNRLICEKIVHVRCRLIIDSFQKQGQNESIDIVLCSR
jgi:hypothetical protein